MRILVVDPHPIFRRGLAASLTGMDGVTAVGEVATPRDACARADLATADLVVLDVAAPDGLPFIEHVRERTGAAVLICTSEASAPSVGAALRRGAAGFVVKEELTHEALRAALAAVAAGSSVIGQGLLQRAFDRAAGGGPAHAASLTEREHGVLTRIADGLPTREIALELSYSERTVKNVLHDVVTKLGVRTRSQAVAHAVRAGLI